MFRLLQLLTPLATLLLVSVKPALATQFLVGRYITYEITTSPNVQVLEKVIITNKETETYPQAYQIKLDEFALVTDTVTASDFNQNPLDSHVEVNDDKTVIKIMPPPTVGKDKQVEFSLSYQIANAVNHHGRISEFALPKLNSSESTQHQVTLKVNRELNNKAYLFPTPARDDSNESWYIYHFLSNQNLNNGIKAAFGEHQIYKFAVEYQLTDANRKDGRYELVLPPDTAYQRVVYDNFSPKPARIDLDPDGNWLAIFPGLNTKSHVNISGTVMLFAQPLFTQTDRVNTEVLTKAQSHWQTEEKVIQELAIQHPAPQQIYNFVVDTLTYNNSKLGDSQSRLGAVGSLQNPENANCMEFTDLFISISRAAGIPARRMIGYARSENTQLRPLSLFTDVLHAWPEYWDAQSNQWKPVDPTWGKTTGGLDYFHTWDLYHFTFAINGYKQDAPEPPIAKAPLKQPQSIIVEPVETFPSADPQLDIKLKLPLISLPYISKTGELTITNDSLFALHDRQPIIPDTHHYTILETTPDHISVLPPLSKTRVRFKYTTTGLLHPKQFIINFNDQAFRLSVTAWDRSKQIIVFIFLIIIYAGFCFAAFKIARKAWRLSVQSK